MTTRRRTLAAAVAAFAVILASACGGGDDDVARLENAIEELEQARVAVEAATTVVDERKEAMEQARTSLEGALVEQGEAEVRLAEAQSQVSLYATDDVLFRTIQKRLLEDRDLKDVAISATVQDGVVLLAGDVPDAKLREQALEIARSVPGSLAVESRIRVGTPAVAAPPEPPAPPAD